MNFAGLDIGTSGCKCSLFGLDGILIHEEYREYNNETKNSFYELDPNLIWKKVKECIKGCTIVNNNIEAISVTSIGESFVLLDVNDNVLLNAMLYTDPRGSEELKYLVDTFSSDYISNITGLYPSQIYSASKLLWISKYKKDIAKKTEFILLFQDFIIYKLSGIRQIDYTLATRTMLFDVVNKKWDASLISETGFKEKQFSKLVEMGTVAGKIKGSLKKELGLTKNTAIVTACHDQIAALIGTGMINEYEAVDGSGTVECITPIFDLKKIDRKKLVDNKFCLIPYINGLYVTYAFTFTGGALLKWYRDKIGILFTEKAIKQGLNPYNYFDSLIDINEPSNLLVLPYFAGAATPYMDNNIQGAILGLTPNSSSLDIYKALMEGIAYELKFQTELLNNCGVEIKKLRATGGGANSSYWVQLKTNLLEHEMETLNSTQSGTIGAIILAQVATGYFKSIEEATENYIKVKNKFSKNNQNEKYYEKYYEKYKKLYTSVKKVMEE